MVPKHRNSHCTDRECVPKEFLNVLVVQARGMTFLHKTRGMTLDTFKQPFKAMVGTISNPKLMYLQLFRQGQVTSTNTSYLAPLELQQGSVCVLRLLGATEHDEDQVSRRGYIKIMMLSCKTFHNVPVILYVKLTRGQMC